MELETTTNGLFTGQILPTKGNAENIGRAIAADCKNGFSNTMETVVRLRAVMLAAETALADLETEILAEVAKYPKGGASILSAKIEPMEGGVKYDYASSGDAKYIAAKATADQLSKELKDREKFLKGLTKPIDEVDMDSGEVCHITPPIKTSKTTYKVTLESKPSILIASPQPGCTLIEPAKDFLGEFRK